MGRKTSERTRKREARLGRNFRVVSTATGVSRVAGFIRDKLNATIFGAGVVSDSYFSALRIPNLLRDLFAEGALSSAFVPVLSKSIEKGRRREAWDLMSQVFTLLLLAVGTVVALGILMAPWIVHFVAPGFSEKPETYNLTVSLTRILFPTLLFVSMAALWMGGLNANHRFGVAAFAPVAMNLTLILCGFYILFFMKGGGAEEETRRIYLWTCATALGFLFQWVIQVPALKSLGARIRLGWPPDHPGVWEMLALMGPAVVTLSVTQVDLMLNQIFASYLPTGSITCLNYGNRLMQLPYGVFGVSIATVVFPLVARHAAAKDGMAVRRTLSEALEAAAFITFPATVGLCLVSLPVSRLIWEGGNLDSNAARMVAEATAVYVAGLFAHTGVKILTPVFYAVGRPKWPFWAAVANMVGTALLNLAAVLWIVDPRLRFLALPAATTFGFAMNLVFLYLGLRLYGVHPGLRGMAAEVSKVTVASLAMGLAVFGLSRSLAGESTAALAVQVFLPVTVGMGLYFGLAKWMGCRSLDWILERRGTRGRA